MSYNLERGSFLPQYTPGFPLLLALAGLAGLEFYVTPLAGLVSCLLMFATVRRIAGRWVGLLFTVLWGMAPIVIFGSTNLMSDLVAATCVMGAYQLCQDKKAAWGAVVMVLGIAVRPTNALLVPVLLPALLQHRQWWRFCAGGLLPALAYGAYNLSVYGAAWRTGYADISSDLLPELFLEHVRFYARQLQVQFGAPLLVLVLLGLLRRGSDAERKGRLWRHLETLAWLWWFVSVTAFYCFWRYPENDDTWWWLRFILPGLPGLFYLAASGWKTAEEELGGRLPAIPLRWAAGIAVCALLLAPVKAVPFCKGNFVWKTNKAQEYRDVVVETESRVPAGAWVGSVEFAGAARIYTKLGSFFSNHSGANALIDELFRRGKPVYLLVEPWNVKTGKEDLALRLKRYQAREVHRFMMWGTAVVLYELKEARRDAGGGGK
jgi:hypothetical protein